MKNKRIYVGVFLICVGVGIFFFSRDNESADKHLNTSYVIEGEAVTLVHGVSEVEIIPGSASKVVTRYFGNDLHTDLNDDGRQDIVFLLTQERGGSGTFFYVVAALATDNGYVGSDAYLLGDRIAPQNITMSSNPRQVNVVVVNYATRRHDEAMATTSSIGTSAYLKLDIERMQWGIVEPNFEGEAR